MSEPKRPNRRGRRPRSRDPQATDVGGEPNPYRDAPDESAVSAADAPAARPKRPARRRRSDAVEAGSDGPSAPAESSAPSAPPPPPAAHAPQVAAHSAPAHSAPAHSAPGGGESGSDFRQNGQRRNSRRGRGRFRKERGGRGPRDPREGREQREPREPREPREQRDFGPPAAVEGSISGWFDAQRDAGFLRRAQHSYLPEPTDPFVQPHMVRQHALRRGDKIDATWGRDHRGRAVVIEITALNDGPPIIEGKRPDFNTLVASYPDRKLTLETGQPAKTGPELTRRAIDLIAPIGYGQRALIVAPARAGKTTLLQAIVQGVATNHPDAALFILLVDERPEEVSEMITWGYGEVVASSFDMPAKRHVEVADMVLERSRRLVEQGKDVVIVLDSITRLARAHNTVERGTGRTLSGGLDSSAMQKPKAFFGSARMIAPENGGGSLTIIATALVETGSRMDDVIFEEFKGTGNCEIKLDRSLADRRIYPAFDIAVSGTRREEKLYRPDQLQKVHLLRRGLAQMPPQAGMEWLIKRISGTPNNDSLLDGL
jgi:transcription termination factor Rho